MDDFWAMKEYVFAGKNMAEIAAPTNPTKMAAILKKLAESEVDVFFNQLREVPRSGLKLQYASIFQSDEWTTYPRSEAVAMSEKLNSSSQQIKKRFRFSNKKRLQKKGPHLSKTQIYTCFI